MEHMVLMPMMVACDLRATADATRHRLVYSSAVHIMQASLKFLQYNLHWISLPYPSLTSLLNCTVQPRAEVKRLWHCPVILHLWPYTAVSPFCAWYVVCTEPEACGGRHSLSTYVRMLHWCAPYR